VVKILSFVKQNDIDLAIYKSIEWVDYINQKSLQNNPGYRKSCSVRIFFLNSISFKWQTIIQKEGKKR
jgi:hypothetical protein